MPILQHKLVMKSIEALHDEALALVPDPASNRGVTAPPAVLHAATPPQDTPINLPKNTSADASADTSADTAQKTASDDDIMARIDQLLKKLDQDDDVAIAPPPVEGPQFEVPQPDTEHMTGDAGHTETADNITTDNLANPDSHVLSDAADHADENAILDVAVDGVAEDTAGKPFGETDNAATDTATDNVSDNLFVDDQPGKTAADDQTQALADIAAAIYQARQQAVDTVVADASQNNAASFDMDALSATVADEVRRAVSAVITAELPKMVRDAVGEAIRTLPADARHQPAPTTGIRSAAKKGTARKTAAIKKAVAKKAGTKKAGAKKPAAKKAAGKTTPKNKLSSKKVGAKKAATKKATAKKTTKST